MIFVGRNKEREVLQRTYASGKPEFIAIYGRRRVGKTYLVRCLYEKEFAFSRTLRLPLWKLPAAYGDREGSGNEKGGYDQRRNCRQGSHLNHKWKCPDFPQMILSRFMPRKLVDNECPLVKLAVQMAILPAFLASGRFLRQPIVRGSLSTRKLE